MAANNRTLFDLDDYVDDDVSFGGGEDEGVAVEGTAQNEQLPPPNYKDQMREASIPVAEAFAVGESQLADEALALQQQLEDERQARLREQRELEEERQARLREQRQLEDERQARLQAERRLVELQDNSPPVSFPDSEPRKTSTTATSTRLEEETPNEEKAGRSKVFLCVALIVLAIAAVGGVCGSGNCTGKSSAISEQNSNAVSEQDPFSSSVPTGLPSNFTSMPTTASFNMSASPMPIDTTFATEIPNAAATEIPTTLAPIPAPRSQPTLRPLPQPTPRPVSPPTRSPVSPRPTQSPVTRPTPRPVVPPTPRPVAPPEPQPTSTTTRSGLIVSYINSITLSGRTLSYPNGNSLPEEEALNWLIEDDVGTSTTDEMKLRQRFALATLWFANGPFDSDTWLTSRDECDWEDILCFGGEEVSNVWLFNDGLNGQLPSDLALLTAMLELVVWDNQLRGSIPTAFGMLTRLTGLYLYNNQLTGTIPTELTRMTAMTAFLVYNNNVSGDMPLCDGAMRPNRFTTVEADCNEVSCPCCTACCPGGGFEGIPSAGDIWHPCDA